MSGGSEFEYMPRLVDRALKEKLAAMPAVLVRGPKWCGKTSTCEQVCSSELKLRDPDVYIRSEEAAAVRPSLLLRGDRPRLLDEWQLLPVLWDAVTSEADSLHGKPGQFLLTGSATPPRKDARKHTGTGRIARLDMATMTLVESRESTEEVSLSALFSGASAVEGASPWTIEQWAHLICRGGWPAPISRGIADATLAGEYIAAICEADLAEASGQAIDPDRARALIHSVSRNVSQEASLPTLLADVKDVGVGMSEPTMRVYLEGLRRLFVVQEVQAWAPALRSRTPLRSARVWHLCDPSLAAAALDVNESGLLDDLVTMGYLFESLCVRDLRVYASLLGGTVYHYRDKSGLEADAIIALPSGAWAGVEVKLGGARRIDDGAKNLIALAAKVDQERSGAPAFLMVLTAGQYAYTRPDGVHVVPLGCLGA